MRPQSLYPLFAPVTSLPGIGPRLGASVERVAGSKVVDLLWHLPNGIVDRRAAPKIKDAKPDTIATMVVRVDAHQKPPTPRLPYKVICSDETGFMTLVFFRAHDDYIQRALPIGELRAVSGRIEDFRGTVQMTHPDYIVPLDELARLQAIEPVYGLTEGLSLKVLGKAARAALGKAPELPEWLDPHLLEAQAWHGWKAALLAAHNPQSVDDLTPGTPERKRLAYDELLATQLAVLLVRAQQRKQQGRSVKGDGLLRAKAIAALPYRLTESQHRALEDIYADMAGAHRMMRLLQGDVGSGKTVVAGLAMLNAIEAGAQAALMAPTEILARQHFKSLAPLAEAAGVELAVLTGRDSGKTRARITAGLADGSIAMVVGTHALFQDDVAFKDLAFAVVDEQHRFGVHQRMALSAKGERADILVMTATPIPRTLLLAVYGDLDQSQLTEKPAGRKPIDTRVVSLDRIDEVYPAIRRAIADRAKVYWVCPLVDESELVDLAAATQRHAELVKLFGPRVGLVHGRMKGPEKDKVMAAFAGELLDVLVATTVIEVGVDVPEATVMVIEHAERFGLAQLHQLRGRIGRGARASTCLLLYQGPLGESARARLQILRETDDGFRIAEEDLRLRGGGELLGTRQSGLPAFRLADLAVHADLLPMARDDAKLILERDPDLSSPRGAALRHLLYLFERDEGVRLLRAG